MFILHSATGRVKNKRKMVYKVLLESFQEEQIHFKRDKYVKKIRLSVLCISTSASAFWKKDLL